MLVLVLLCRYYASSIQVNPSIITFSFSLQLFSIKYYQIFIGGIISNKCRKNRKKRCEPASRAALALPTLLPTFLNVGSISPQNAVNPLLERLYSVFKSRKCYKKVGSTIKPASRAALQHR